MAEFNPYDHYFKKAKTSGYKARSAFKLEEMQNKFNLITKNTHSVLDIGCSPGSWMQYTATTLQNLNVKKYNIIGFDIKSTELNLPNIQTYIQDITNKEEISNIFKSNNIKPNIKQDEKKNKDKKTNIKGFDFIQSDMAPNTIGLKDIDAIRLFDLLEQSLRIYKNYLNDGGKFAIKVFMGPGFEEFVANMKKIFGGKSIKVFKPKASRKESKEIYIIKI